MRAFVREFVRTVENMSDLSDYLVDQEKEMASLTAQNNKLETTIRTYTEKGLGENNEALKLQMILKCLTK